ncbi:MAG: hypothetical protein MK132_05425 [Lentisphaerales bacterium]|nr:hypothetical protein [Lentisphaerales bacterium]
MKTDNTGFVRAESTTIRRMRRAEQKNVNVPVIVMSVMVALLGLGFFTGYLIISSEDEKAEEVIESKKETPPPKKTTVNAFTSLSGFLSGLNYYIYIGFYSDDKQLITMKSPVMTGFTDALDTSIVEKIKNILGLNFKAT